MIILINTNLMNILIYVYDSISEGAMHSLNLSVINLKLEDIWMIASIGVGCKKNSTLINRLHF